MGVRGGYGMETMSEITQLNAKAIAYKARIGIDNGGVDRDAFANYMDHVGDTLHQLRAENARLADELAEVQEMYRQLVKQADANYHRAREAEKTLSTFQCVTVARIYSGAPMLCDGDGDGPGCKHAALWEVQRMREDGSDYSHLCVDHLDDYQKWASEAGYAPMVFEATP